MRAGNMTFQEEFLVLLKKHDNLGVHWRLRQLSNRKEFNYAPSTG
jgi:hypothetical protein